jgi:hypothetical protein
MYKPWSVFRLLTLLFLILGITPYIRYLVLTLQGDQGNHIQSLVLGGALLVGGALSLALGILSDLAKSNRILLEDQLERSRELQYGHAVPAARPELVAPAKPRRGRAA